MQEDHRRRAPHHGFPLRRSARSILPKCRGARTAQGIPFTVNPSIVRGLDYYTRTVFEFVSDDIGAQGTVCGGGRYNHLVEEVGGKPTPAVGFGSGA